MINIEETDFRTLEEFPIKWRWTDSRWNKLPEDALKTIMPFTEAKAHELSQHSLEYRNYAGLSESVFENISQIDASGDLFEVKQWLLNYCSDENQMVIVSWDQYHAV